MEKHKTLPVLSNSNQNDDVKKQYFDFEIERDLLQSVFQLIDLDHSGFIDTEEMSWALSHDAQVSTLAASSLVLKTLLKTRQVDSLLTEMDDDRSGTVSWGEFQNFCKKSFAQCVVHEKERLARIEKEKKAWEIKEAKKADHFIKAEEDRARKVFELVDTDGSGTIEQEEMLQALQNNEKVREYVQASKALQPLLDNKMFSQAFMAMNTDDDEGISLDEFTTFVTELASIVILNDMDI